HFEVDYLVDLKTNVPFHQVLGKPATIKIEGREGGTSGSDLPRYIHGIVSGLREMGADDSFTQYRMEIVPTLWLLTKRIHSRVFQQQTVQHILETMLKGLNVSFKLHGTYNEHNYCVQYAESDFAFVSRIMEEEGLFYYFTHDEHQHTLQIADTSTLNP